MSGRFRIIVLVLLAVCSWFGWVFASETWLGSTPAPEAIKFTLLASRDTRQVADDLQREGVIASAWRYRLYELMNVGARHPKPGDYVLRRGQSYRDIARMLALGPGRREVEIRLIEGKTIDDLADRLLSQEAIPLADTRALVGRSADRAPFDLKFREDFPVLQKVPSGRSLEGYLFPETYRVWGDQLPEGLVRKQLQEFQDRFGAAVITNKSAPLKTLDEVVILASIVEAEVRDDADRRIVAGIFMNRLRDGMALQTDATLSYLTKSGRARSTSADLSIDSPYNTYKYRGLPPSPINNPGESALNAVLNPVASEYRFFLTDAAGKVYYARTLEEHTANRRRAGY